MNTKHLVIIGVALVLTLAALGVIFLLLNTSKSLPSPHDTTFPASTSVTGTGGSVTLTTLHLFDGSTLQTRDFLADPATKEDTENKGYFYLGNQPSDTAAYSIEYISETQYFNIELLQEPLGANRKVAESYLINALGISSEQMCGLNYSVGTPNSVNSAYAGMNLGFSFCPVAVKLP